MEENSIQNLTIKVIIYPLITLIGILDSFLGAIFPNNYDNADIPEPSAVLTKQVNDKDINSGYR